MESFVGGPGHGGSSGASNVKYVLVSGGVISGIGKGLTASSIGVLLKACGWRVTAVKVDPYLNCDAGTMSPFEHGEVFVLDDGGEVDLDLGNYERFLDVTLNRSNNITTGKVYQAVLTAERRGDYLGKTVQVVPHVTDAIITWIQRVAATPDADTGLPPEVVVIELGGTVGDIESMPFIEALRQLRYAVGEANFCSVFVSLVPELGVVGEQKTKPTQHGVKNLSMSGLAPQLIVCRSTRPLLAETKAKLGLFCQVPPDAVVSVHDVSPTTSRGRLGPCPSGRSSSPSSFGCSSAARSAAARPCPSPPPAAWPCSTPPPSGGCPFTPPPAGRRPTCAAARSASGTGG